MTDFESTERRTMSNSDPTELTFHNKPVTRYLPSLHPPDENAGREWWDSTFRSRILALYRDADHSLGYDYKIPTNPTRAQIVEVYERAYSEIVELLKDTHNEVERARGEVRSLSRDREWLKDELVSTGADRIKHQERVEILLDLLAKARLARQDAGDQREPIQ